MIISLVIKIAAFLIWLYLGWRRKSEDYGSEAVVSLGWLGWLGWWLGGRLVWIISGGAGGGDWWISWLDFWNYPGFSIWGGVAGFWLVVLVFALVRDLKFWSLGEDYLFLLFVLILGWLAGEWGRQGGGLRGLGEIGVAILTLVLVFWLGGKYRSFVWYKSGKKGFLVLAAGVITGILMSGVSILMQESYSLVGTYLALVLISTLGLVILGQVLEIKLK